MIDFEIVGKRAHVTLNRPHKANALSSNMVSRLHDIFVEAADHSSIHAVILTGAGDRAFCGGADLSEPDTMKNSTLWENLAGAMENLPVLSVALINGPCIGGGMALALGCDIRIGTPRAIFGYPVLRNRLLPSKHDIHRLDSLVGPGRNAMLFLGGLRLSATEAADWGLLDSLVTEDELDAIAVKVTAAACEVERDHVVNLKSRIRGKR